MSEVRRFERALWAVRYIIIVPVVVLIFTAIGVIIITTVAAVRMGHQMVVYLMPGGGAPGRVQPMGAALQVVEGYLLAAILVIFAVGLYELFIAKIEMIERSEIAPRALLIRSINDLKQRLGRVVLLGLVIEFFQQSLQLQYGSPIELLYMAVGIVLVGAALYLTTPRDGN